MAPLVAEPDPPATIAPLGDPSTPSTFLEAGNPVCAEWDETASAHDEDTAAWLALDATVPASEWTPEHKAVMDAVAPMMLENADRIEELGRESGNPVFDDFAVMATQYQRAYVKALPTYTKTDSFLGRTSSFLVKSIIFACESAT